MESNNLLCRLTSAELQRLQATLLWDRLFRLENYWAEEHKEE